MRLASSDASRGQSESTGVILIVLVAFILGSLVAAFAFTTFDEESGVAPGVAFSYEYEEAGIEELTIRVESERGGPEEDGNGFEGADVEFVCRSGSCSTLDGTTWDDQGGGSGPDGRVIAGDAVTLPKVGADAKLLVRWEEPVKNGKSVIIGAWEGPAV